MSLVGFVFAFLFLEDAQFFQALPSKCGLLEFALTLAVLAMLIEDLQEVFRNELRWVELLIFELSLIDNCCVIANCLGTCEERVIHATI